MGKAVELTGANFREVVEKNGIVLIDWWAEWCGPCRAFAPVFERVAAKNDDIVFGKVNTDAEQELSSTFQIRSIPTLMIFRDKVLLFSQAGALPEAGLEDLVKQVRALDMDKVRQEIADSERAHQAEKAEKPN
jgi:thioredoxin 1